jgi:hypothetical protein
LQAEIRIGNRGVFGADVGVVNAFDGLRHVMELLGDVESKFLTMPYVELVKLVRKLNQSVTHFTTRGPWATETTEVRRMIGETQKNLLLLWDRSVGPLVSMYNYYTDSGSPVPGNKLEEAIVGLQRNVATLKENPGGQAPLGMGGFGIPVPNPVGGSGLVALKALMAAAEQKNANLEAEVAQLKHVQAQVRPQALFGGSTFGGVGIGDYGGAGAMGSFVRCVEHRAKLASQLCQGPWGAGCQVRIHEGWRCHHDWNLHFQERIGLQGFLGSRVSQRFAKHVQL